MYICVNIRSISCLNLIKKVTILRLKVDLFNWYSIEMFVYNYLKIVINSLLPINVRVVFSSKCLDCTIEWMLKLHSFVFEISKMVPYWRLIFLKGFKWRLKGTFALDLQDVNINDDFRTLETNICNKQQRLKISISFTFW